MDHTDHLYFTTDHGPDHTDHALFARMIFKTDHMIIWRCRKCGPALMAASTMTTRGRFPRQRLRSRAAPQSPEDAMAGKGSGGGPRTASPNNYSDGRTPHEHLFSLSVGVGLTYREFVWEGARANESERE